MSLKKQESFTEMMIKYAKTIPDDTEISMRLIELYKDTIYDRVYNIIKTIFRLNLNKSLPYNFFKTLSIDSISKTIKLAPLIPAFNYKGDPGHYLEQVKHFVAFCVYCESNFSRNTTTESFSILHTSEPPECVSLFIYHGGSSFVSEELKQDSPSAKYRYFLIAPPTEPLLWDIGLEPLVNSIYNIGLNKPTQREIISQLYLNFNEELLKLEMEIQEKIKQMSDEEDIKVYEDYLELCISKQEKTLELSTESKINSLKELKYNCVEAYKESFEGSHPEDGSKYAVGFYLLPKLPNTAITVETSIIHFLNMYIQLKINSNDDDKDQLIMCLPGSELITSDNYSIFIENCMRNFIGRPPIKIEKGYGNQYGTWMYEYFNYFVSSFGGEELKRYFFALFGCGRSACPSEDDRYIDDYIISVKFLLDLVQNFCGPTIILDGSCNEETENYERAFENSQPLDSSCSSQGGIPDTRPGGRPGGGTRKKNKKLKKSKKKNKNNKKSKKMKKLK